MSASSTSAVRQSLDTVVTILITPFDRQGGLDEESFITLVRRNTEAGISVITPNGNTGEFYSLSAGERRRTVELCVAAETQAAIVAGVGLDVATAIADTEAAIDAGAHGVMIHQPVHPFSSLDGWVGYHRAISQAVPDVPLVAYVKDSRVGVEAMSQLLHACPNLVGVKYAVPDPAALGALTHALGSDQVSWLCGVAERWAPFFWLAGATGMTSGLATVDPERSLRLQKALDNEDHHAAMREWASIVKFEELRARDDSEVNVSIVKEALAQLALCGRTVRAPITEVSHEDRAAVARILNLWGVV
ncbi:MAG: dihydrodipicolinate synthase [Marmoricola sp.]|nr:dihydrodipicolinate synthase [Marmoricola sp.]